MRIQNLLSYQSSVLSLTSESNPTHQIPTFIKSAKPILSLDTCFPDCEQHVHSVFAAFLSVRSRENKYVEGLQRGVLEHAAFRIQNATVRMDK